MINRSSIHDACMWLGLCPLLAIAATWPIALVLGVCLLLTIASTATGLGSLQRCTQPALRLPLAALIAGTLVVLEHLMLAAWWPMLDAAIAPWLVLVAGLTVLVCLCYSNEGLHKSRTPTPAPLPMGEGLKAASVSANFIRSMKWGFALSAALLLIGIARDGLGRVFLLAQTPAGALLLLALLLAVANTISGSPAPPLESAKPFRMKSSLADSRGGAPSPARGEGKT